MKSRIEDAVNEFESGCNCCQAVFCAYADLYGMDKETARRISASFGGGIGQMREVCGTVSALALLAGLANGSGNPADKEKKSQNYKLVRSMAEEFKELNGSIVCKELLGLVKDENKQPIKKKPCKELVRIAAEIAQKYLEHQPDETGGNNINGL